MPQRGLLFVFSGPSGAGKNTIMRQVLQAEKSLRQLPTATTRPKRNDEQEGREHEFLTESEFRQRILDKELVEWQIIHDRSVYGVPRKTVQRIIEQGQLAVADVDVLGAMDLKREFGDCVVLIFVQTPDTATLEKRLRGRADVKTEDELRTRLRRAEFEMSFADEYDYLIVNADSQLAASVQQALEIVHDARDNRPAFDQHPDWDNTAIEYQVTGVVIHNGCILQHDNTFPRLPVPAGALPFDTLGDYFRSTLGIEMLPARPHAEKRAVSSGFEPPQLVKTTRKVNTISKNLIYILKPATLLDSLPAGWQWVLLERLYHLDEALQTLVLEYAGDLQAAGFRANEQ